MVDTKSERREAVDALGGQRVLPPKSNTSRSHRHCQLKSMNPLEAPLFPSSTSMQRKITNSYFLSQLCGPAVESEILMLLKVDINVVVQTVILKVFCLKKSNVHNLKVLYKNLATKMSGRTKQSLLQQFSLFCIHLELLRTFQFCLVSCIVYATLLPFVN